MAIADAGKLGDAISKHDGNLEAALEEYQQERMAQTAKEVRLQHSCPTPCLLLPFYGEPSAQFPFSSQSCTYLC